MKRRNFIFKGFLGAAGLLGFTAMSAVTSKAYANGNAGKGQAVANSGLDLIQETIEEDFKYKGRHVQLLKRVYHPGGGPKDAKVNRWAMKLNGKELPPALFNRLDESSCFYSQLQPFLQDECDPKKLAELIVDGEVMQLYKLQ